MANIHFFIHIFTTGSASAFRGRSLFSALLFAAMLALAMPAVSSPDEAPMLAQSGSENTFKVGSYVKFGRYPQSGNTPEPIEWLVLENNGSNALLISRYGLDCRPFHYSKATVVSWENCDLRTWLNKGFYDSAFSAYEKQSIKISRLRTLANKQYGTAGCDETEDKVFCLSIEELDKYISSPADRKCHITSYAVSRNVYANSSGNGYYWLRSPGKTDRDVIFANYDGTVSYSGCDATADRIAVRPALRVSMNAGVQSSSDSSAKPQSSNDVQSVASSRATSAPKAANFRVGSYVQFGRYPQNNGDTPEPIEWLVLENDGNTALLLSKYGLDCQLFNNKWVDIGWRDCDLRKGLNGTFLNHTFNSEEQRQIAESVIYTGDNPEYGTKGSGETRDKVFCLSIEEAKKYFDSDNARKCQPTSYAVSCDAWKNDEGNCWFWLRSPGISADSAAIVSDTGAVHIPGIIVIRGISAVRPALRIKL